MMKIRKKKSRRPLRLTYDFTEYDFIGRTRQNVKGRIPTAQQLVNG